jgi:Secretion system C-terminal sorting domain
MPFTCLIMKKNVSTALLVCASLAMSANNPELIVQKLNNNGAVAGQTYRVFCKLPDAASSLQIVYGDAQHPLSIVTEGQLYQHEFGGSTSASINQNVVETYPTLKYDSWLTVGFENSTENELWDLGVNFQSFDQAGQLEVNNGGWFLVPGSNKCAPNADGLVLLAQLTTSGKVTGSLNVQGQDSNGAVWQGLNLTFSTDNAVQFACGDKEANNYQPDANYHDQQLCTYKSGQNPVVSPSTEINKNDWSVFPNPMRDDLINIQFNMPLVESSKPAIQIFDNSGKLVHSEAIFNGQLVNANRLTISKDLPAGAYQIVLTQGTAQSSKSLIVQK